MNSWKLPKRRFLCGCALIGLTIFLLTETTDAKIFCVGTAGELQSALIEAETNGENDVIHVLQGTYNGNFTYTSVEPYALTIEGGYLAGCSSRDGDATNTVLDGNGAGSALRVIAPNASVASMVSELTFQNGASGNSVGVAAAGAGLHVETKNISIIHNIFRNNSTNNSAEGGGGVYIESPDVATVSHNTVKQNTSNHGGGVFIEVGGLLTIDNNIFENNSGQYMGGGLRINGNENATELVLNDNLFTNNTATYGAGVSISTCKKVSVTNNRIIGNSATFNDGGVGIGGSREVVVVNNVISHNFGDRRCGGLAANAYYDGDSITLTNNTIVYNSGNGTGGGIWFHLNDDRAKADLYNNIIYGNTAAVGNDIYLLNDYNGNGVSSVVNLFNNDFDQSAIGTYFQLPFSFDGSNLNNNDPLFIDPLTNDYHLSKGSPCIDKGSALAPALPLTDFDGDNRIIGSTPDIGADEYSEVKVTVAIDIKPGSDQNSINPKSKGKIPVAILSTPAFDGPVQVDTDSLTFGPTGDEKSLAFCNPNGEDVNGDGLKDLVCHFYTQFTGFKCGDTVGTLQGQTKDEIPMAIQGSDSVRINPCK